MWHQDGVLTSLSFSWERHPELTWAIITYISEHESVRKGLYSSGKKQSTANGGGKRKQEFHWEIAAAVLGDHEALKESIKDAVEGNLAKQKWWAGKIKNRLHT